MDKDFYDLKDEFLSYGAPNINEGKNLCFFFLILVGVVKVELETDLSYKGEMG